MSESVRHFCEGDYFRRWCWLKRCSSYLKWPAVCTSVFLLILLAKRLCRLIRELILSCCKLLLSCSITIAKLLNQNFFWVLKLPLTALRCYDTNVWLFTYLNNKLFSHELLNYDGLWENRKIPDENQRFGWIKSIHGYRLVKMVGSLISTCLTRWFDLINNNP